MIEALNEIYCENCAFLKVVEASMGCVGYHCKAVMTPKKDFMHKWKSPADCCNINANNDCDNYQPNLRKRIWDFIWSQK